MHCTE